MRFTTLFILASTIVSGLTQSTEIIQESLSEIANQINHFMDVATPLGTTGTATFIDFLNLHSLFQVLTATIDRAAHEAQNTPQPLSDVDSNAIITSTRRLEPIIMEGLALIKAKKFATGLLPSPVAIIVNPLKTMTNNIVNLRSSTTTLTNALVDVVQDSSKPEGREFSDRVAMAITSTVRFYQVQV